MSFRFLFPLISNKLIHDNYLLYKRQIVPFIHGRGLYRYLDESSPAPLAMIMQETVGGDEKIISYEIPNPEYDKWVEKEEPDTCGIYNSYLIRKGSLDCGR